MLDDYLDKLINFLVTSPTAYHAASNLAAVLVEQGFDELDEMISWGSTPAAGFVRRDGALIAWRQPDDWTPTTGLRIVAAHTDSPALKLKPGGTFGRVGFGLSEVEVYGGPILHTWLDRDLAIAGRLVDLDGGEHLVQTEAFLRVPTLAIHLDRGVNEGLAIDAQRDLNALFALGGQIDTDELELHVAGLAGLTPDQVGGHDLILVPTQPPAVLGLNGEFLASYRLDNLLSVHSGLSALLAAQASDQVQVFVAFDHEEIGSSTATGASGPFLVELLRRLSLAQGWGEDAHLAWLRRGWAISADVAHGVHPNRSDRHDPQIQPRLNGGPVLKWSAPMRYATDAASAAQWTRACRQAGVESQVFVNNNSVRGGSSLGPLLATRLGVRTVDAGIAVVSMHSARELCGAEDPRRFAQVAASFLTASPR